MIKKTLVIPVTIIAAFLMMAIIPNWVNTSRAADVDTYIQIIRDLNTPYEEEFVTLLTQLDKHLYEGNTAQAEQIGKQLNQILDKLPKDQQDALTMLDCDVTEGSQSCDVTNCDGITICKGDPATGRVICFCSRNGECTADCDNTDCSADGNDQEKIYCYCDEDGKGYCRSMYRMPLASTIGILILITLIIGSGLWLWKRKTAKIAA